MKYLLKNDRLEVGFTSLGGALTSIKNEAGTEYLWQGDPEYWSGQAPVLFPICGSLRDNKAVKRWKADPDAKAWDCPKRRI